MNLDEALEIFGKTAMNDRSIQAGITPDSEWDDPEADLEDGDW